MYYCNEGILITGIVKQFFSFLNSSETVKSFTVCSHQVKYHFAVHRVKMQFAGLDFGPGSFKLLFSFTEKKQNT